MKNTKTELEEISRLWDEHIDSLIEEENKAEISYFSDRIKNIQLNDADREYMQFYRKRR